MGVALCSLERVHASVVETRDLTMNRIGLVWLGLLPVAFGQKAFTAKFEDCGSLLNIQPALVDGVPTRSVTITAPFNRKTGRHILGKGKNVKICINGTVVPNSVPLPVAGAALKNSAHGKVIVNSNKVIVYSNKVIVNSNKVIVYNNKVIVYSNK